MEGGSLGVILQTACIWGIVMEFLLGSNWV